jgi:hypothetical protein
VRPKAMRLGRIGESRPTLRLAYLLYFMPPHAFRTSSVLTELARLGYRRPNGATRARFVEWGAGPATATYGALLAESFAPMGWPSEVTAALIEQDGEMLELGQKWLSFASERAGFSWNPQTFRRRIEFDRPLLPRSAPGFDLWLMSYFLNESALAPEQLAHRLVESWERHLNDEGLVVIAEPALKSQSRKLLALRGELLKRFEKRDDFQVLTPCLGHQACGALTAPEDWCHELVSWWRPMYLRKLDDLMHLDHKSLPFSYLVIARSKRRREEILPELAGANFHHRLVSPPHGEGKGLEYFVCGPDGKRRVRSKKVETESGEAIERGSILMDAELRGDSRASQLDSFRSAK